MILFILTLTVSIAFLALCIPYCSVQTLAVDNDRATVTSNLSCKFYKSNWWASTFFRLFNKDAHSPIKYHDQCTSCRRSLFRPLLNRNQWSAFKNVSADTHHSYGFVMEVPINIFSLLVMSPHACHVTVWYKVAVAYNYTQSVRIVATEPR